MSTDVTQDRIFELYVDMAKHSSYARIGHFNIIELIENFPETDVIEMLIVMEGACSLNWEFGHISRRMDEMIGVFGAKLIPYLERRRLLPFHSGGTANGEAFLRASRQRCVAFCEQMLDKLRILLQNPSDPASAYFAQFAGGIE